MSVSPPINIADPSFIDPSIDSRSISFENPDGARGAGGTVGGGRKGQPFYIFEPGERLVIASIEGPGTIRHIWMTLDLWAPATLRSLRLDVYYDDLDLPSVSVPLLDFFGLVHGRLSEFSSALVVINEGRGLNTYVPIPFGRSVRMEVTNASTQPVTLFMQIDYTLEPERVGDPSYLHATFRRENPTTPRRDFVIATGLRGPGRYLGCVVGIRTIDAGVWYGEGEVKIYRDGDCAHPTICGTGLEDYVGSAWGLGRHATPYSGVPLNLVHPARTDRLPFAVESTSSYVGFYRWHVLDPIMFADELTVTIQQLGSGGDRVDDYCATAFVYCRSPQPVPVYDVVAGSADIDPTIMDAPKGAGDAVRDHLGAMAEAAVRAEIRRIANLPDAELAAFNRELMTTWGGQLRREVTADGASWVPPAPPE